MEYTRALLGRVTPEAVFENPRGQNLVYLLDDVGLEQALRIAADPEASKIYIFSIRAIEAALQNRVLDLADANVNHPR